MIECFCVPFLARPEFLPARKRLREKLVVMENCSGDLSAFGKADIHFHLAIIEGSGHQLFGNVMRGLLRGLGVQFARETYISSELVETKLNEHRAICKALELGRGALARQKLRRHLLSSRRHLEQLLRNSDAVR